MKKGFTLIELLIVITIIGILAVAFLPSVLGAPSKARDTQRIAHIQKIAGVLTTLQVSNSLPDGIYCINATGDLAGALKAADFGGKLPTDPQTGADFGACDGYWYMKGLTTVANNYSFGAFAKLENASMGNFETTNCGSGAACTFPTTAVTGAANNQNMASWKVVTATTTAPATSYYAILVQ